MCRKHYFFWVQLFIALLCAYQSFGMDASLRQQLITAIEKDAVQEIASLVDEKKVDVNAIIDDDFGVTLLLHAASLGAVKVGELLLERGASKDTMTKCKQSCMSIACQGNKLDFIKMLRARGVSLDATEKDKRSPLEFAIVADAVETVDFLLEHNVSRAPLEIVVPRQGDVRMPSGRVELLIEEYKPRFSLLHFAVFVNALRVCNLLCTKYRFDPNEKIPFRKLTNEVVQLTPNDIAVMSSNWPIAQILKDNGANAKSHHALMLLYFSKE
ncbi:MAG: hypothetical protein AB7F19_06965 [Candidatus Babeliales bacterium]